MMLKLQKVNSPNVIYDVTSLIGSFTWQGTDAQVTRKLNFTAVYNPYDENISFPTFEEGDKVYFFDDDNKRIYVGRIKKRNYSAKSFEGNYESSDFCDMLVKSRNAFKFKKKTPEEITEIICAKYGIETGHLEKTGIKLKKIITEDESPYNIILGAYDMARKKNGKKYMAVMDGVKLSVIEKGESSGVSLSTKVNVEDIDVALDGDSIINRVHVTNKNGKSIKTIEDKDSISLYGVYSTVLQVEDGDTDITKSAKALFESVKKEISLSALGDIRAVSGRSIIIKDEITDTAGKFYISEDTHTFSGGTHKMSLKLRFENLMESEFENTKVNPFATAEATCYYTETGGKFHSREDCSRLLNPILKTTVQEALECGKDKCSKCWQ